MKNSSLPYLIINGIIAMVWLVNGMWAKVLGNVPRHEEIVGNILSIGYSRELTLAIGLGETVFALWIFMRKFPRQTTILQCFIILLMNIIETIYVPELLLWGRWNLVFALAFIALVLFNDIKLRKRT